MKEGRREGKEEEEEGWVDGGQREGRRWRERRTGGRMTKWRKNSRKKEEIKRRLKDINTDERERKKNELQ